MSISSASSSESSTSSKFNVRIIQCLRLAIAMSHWWSHGKYLPANLTRQSSNRHRTCNENYAGDAIGGSPEAGRMFLKPAWEWWQKSSLFFRTESSRTNYSFDAPLHCSHSCGMLFRNWLVLMAAFG